MIAWLSGKIKTKKPSSVIIDTGGVGYLVHISIPTYYALPEPGEIVSLHIYSHIREDIFQLYGFFNKTEQEVFEKLISLSKVGPKLAMNMLSGLPAAKLADAVRRKDAALLSSIPGVGAKTADRIILELADKLQGLGESAEDAGAADGPSGADNDAVEALLALGYKAKDAQKAVKAARAADMDGALEEIIRGALRRIS
ncbi:MAG: Holliday junction branch migration protein RuvA [Nitrospinota bacterium]|nr:Holliday junction branch migration protein RuvA [Nitrospinota bacterium]MDH5677622.1 Holliday junction branch migration protein RuvA [Nitrospinota bacterium]MDH5756415.1 Holliday junction branch migration protein RuvA [Nitrospinota bacterium]